MYREPSSSPGTQGGDGEALGGDTSPLFTFLRVAHIALLVTGAIALLIYRPVRSEDRTPAVIH